MLVSEFIDRTGYRPSAEEYADIEQAYYVFDGDKDVYCRAWCKANPHKAGKLREAIKEQERLSKVFDRVCKYVRKVTCKETDRWWYDMTSHMWWEYCNTMADVCKCKDRQELRTMVKRLRDAHGITSSWSSQRWEYFWQLEKWV